jgi:hypothetical protein
VNYVLALISAIAVWVTGIAPPYTLNLDLATQKPSLPATSTAKSPTVRIITTPDFWGSYAIWGATGNDALGHVWIGVTSNDDRGSGSAHLYEYDPVGAVITDRGSVVEQLERLKLRRAGETQMKIHSRIVQAADGRLYFTSMDETGEHDDGSKMPTWGGHLWRLGPQNAWRHLAATPEALIAAAVGGPYVYALGYFNHVLYQFDTRSGRSASVTVGSVGGHVSRNFFADARGHAYVPRIRRAGDQTDASLVEFDASLKEVGSTPLTEYFEGPPDQSHGIVATLPDGGEGWYFTTGKGRLYRVEPQATGPSRVSDLGWFHPAGSRYVASLFRDATSGAVYGVSSPGSDGSRKFEWVTRRTDGSVTLSPLPYGEAASFPEGAVLYGSMTHDKAGRFYVVGSMKYKPVVLQITP